VICPHSAKTEIANKKSHNSYQVIRLSMTLVIFQGHYSLDCFTSNFS